MKKMTAFVLAVLMVLSLAGCGGETGTPQQTEITRVGTTAAPQRAEKARGKSGPAEVQDIVTFFEGIRRTSVVATEEYYYARYVTGFGGMELLHQYVDTVCEEYPFSLVEKNIGDDGISAWEYYYLRYEGEDRVKPVWSGEEWHIAVEADADYTDKDIYISVKYSPDIYLKDAGRRADHSETLLPVLTPTPKPTPSPTPKPTPRPTQRPATTPSKPAQSVAVDKNATYIPEFSAFLGRAPSEEKDRYYGGTRKYYQKLPLETQSAVVSEVLALLNNNRYQLKLIEKVDSGNRIDYNYSYTGNVAMDSIHGRNDDSRYYNLQFTVFNKNNDNGYYGIHFHYSPQFTEENVGYRVSVGLSGGGGGGGITGDTENFAGDNVREFSKLECLTCHGTKDCQRCNGRGYIIEKRIKSDCTRCNRGKCPKCKGTGLRS